MGSRVMEANVFLRRGAGLLAAGVTGEAGENNCFTCIGGATPASVPGACGSGTATAGSTMAIYARGF